MRLLRASGDDDFSLVSFHDIRNVPPYAILSHTWGEDYDEVTFKDIFKGKGKCKRKPGYAKLKFCAAQAAKDEIEYFWIDTCCIDQSSSAELSEAINSMFSWYERAKICYVFLADVTNESFLSRNGTFHNSRWFTRGWTPQELIAPKSLAFFSSDSILLGTKAVLAHDIADITGIPAAAIKMNRRCFSYSVEKRVLWGIGRQTKREEDSAYCLLGLLRIHLPLIYGEGKANPFARLRKETRESGCESELQTLIDRYWPHEVCTIV
jgi:hypothetical protein